MQEYFFVNKTTDPEALRMENGEEGHATGPAMGSFGLDFGIDFKEGQVKKRIEPFQSAEIRPALRTMHTLTVEKVL